MSLYNVTYRNPYDMQSQPKRKMQVSATTEEQARHIVSDRLPNAEQVTIKKQTLYGLFSVTINANGKKVYERIGTQAYPKAQAIRVFQNALLAPYLGNQKLATREIRPLK